MQRAPEILPASASDAGFRIGRDVRRYERSDRRGEEMSSCIGRAAFGCMASPAIAGLREIGAPHPLCLLPLLSGSAVCFSFRGFPAPVDRGWLHLQEE